MLEISWAEIVDIWQKKQDVEHNTLKGKNVFKCGILFK